MKRQFTGKETQMAVTSKLNGDQENANLNHKILLHTHKLVNPKPYQCWKWGYNKKGALPLVGGSEKWYNHFGVKKKKKGSI